MADTNISTTKVCTLCKIEHELSYFFNDKNRKDGKHPHCKPCNKIRMAARYLQNRDVMLAATRENYKNNKDSYKARARDWAAKNPEARKSVVKKYVKNNPEQRYATQRQNRLNNPGMYAAHFKMRQQRKKLALSGWANLGAIEALYIECARITKETGIKHHVDHFYPLKSDIVCGLHNEFNLRIIPAKDNLSKGNSFPTEAS